MANLRMYNNIKANLSSDANLKGNITVGSVNVGGADMTNYYDKEEVDGLLENKADVEHDHIVKSGLLRLNTQEAFDFLKGGMYTDAEINQLIVKYAAPIKHNHDDRYANSVVLAAKFGEKANKEHTHEEYLTEHQDISGKADITYVDNAINTALNGIESQLDEIIGEEV